MNNKIFIDVEKDIYELSLSYDRDFGDFHNSFGISYIYDDHIAKRYLKPLEKIFLTLIDFQMLRKKHINFMTP